MRAKDIMLTSVVTVHSDATLHDVVNVLAEHGISAVPVVGPEGLLLGIVQEGALLRQVKADTAPYPPQPGRHGSELEDGAMVQTPSHGGLARDVMIDHMVTVDEEATLEEVAELMKKHGIKHVPVVHDGKVVGMIDRRILLYGIADRKSGSAAKVDDEALRAAVERALSEAHLLREHLRVAVTDGVVHLEGVVPSDVEKQAARIAAETVPGVTRVRDALGVLSTLKHGAMWG